MEDLISISDLPEGFSYPAEFVRVVELGLTNLEPWWILGGDHLRSRFSGMKARYPSRNLVPFARRQDNDDVACWDPPGSRVFVVHDFATAGWEHRSVYPDFYSWLRQAIEDLIELD